MWGEIESRENGLEGRMLSKEDHNSPKGPGVKGLSKRKNLSLERSAEEILNSKENKHSLTAK